jgi:SAM-dependent methyltransferase
MWVPRLACPECGDRVTADGQGGYRCEGCALPFAVRDGVLRFLTPARTAAAQKFVQQYRMVRERDGHRDGSPEFYRALPVVRRDHPHADEWRIRRESYAALQKEALPVWSGPTHILDLGAGNCWLSHRLASFGHRVVAVDYLDDEVDGLGVCRWYPDAFAVVQADFDALPFEPFQFEVVVLNASLHYSPDPLATLGEAKRMLAPGGTMVVMDSPMFEEDGAGRAMLDRQRETWAQATGVEAPLQPGLGYLTFELLAHAAGVLGLRARFHQSHGPWPWRIRREMGRWRQGRPPAAFGVWVAQ